MFAILAGGFGQAAHAQLWLARVNENARRRVLVIDGSRSLTLGFFGGGAPHHWRRRGRWTCRL
jgi:hypothetical protein